MIIVGHSEHVALGHHHEPILLEFLADDAFFNTMESSVGARITSSAAFARPVINQQEPTLGFEGRSNGPEELGSVHRHIVEIVKCVLHGTR